MSSRAWNKEKILNLHEESNSDLRISRSDALPLSHYGEQDLMIRVLHAAKISNVNSVMFVNRIREMVSFELGKEIEKDAFRLVTSVEQRKRF